MASYGFSKISGKPITTWDAHPKSLAVLDVHPTISPEMSAINIILTDCPTARKTIALLDVNPAQQDLAHSGYVRIIERNNQSMVRYVFSGLPLAQCCQFPIKIIHPSINSQPCVSPSRI